MNTQFGFVILHYMAYEMTVECIEYLQELYANTEYSVRIVIVDNASSNGSGEKLRDLYKDCKNIDVLINHKNLGFAQGNNLGYLYLKANYNCDFIVIMNNDVLIEQNDFLEKIKKLYSENNFAVLGPDIYSPKLKDSQSPIYRNDIKFLYGMDKESVSSLNKSLCDFYKKRYYYWLRHTFFGWLRKFIPYKKNAGKETESVFDSSKNYENVVLHGACYIFSKDFIQKRNFAFNQETFLYFEEDILHYECAKEKLTMLYSPCIKVTHLEDISTDSVYKSSFKKTKFKNKNLQKSTGVLLDLMTSTQDTRGGVLKYSVGSHSVWLDCECRRRAV